MVEGTVATAEAVAHGAVSGAKAVSYVAEKVADKVVETVTDPGKATVAVLTGGLSLIPIPGVSTVASTVSGAIDSGLGAVGDFFGFGGGSSKLGRASNNKDVFPNDLANCTRLFGIRDWQTCGLTYDVASKAWPWDASGNATPAGRARVAAIKGALTVSVAPVRGAPPPTATRAPPVLPPDPPATRAVLVTSAMVGLGKTSAPLVLPTAANRGSLVAARLRAHF